MPFDTTFTMDTSSIKYGRGATREAGSDLKRLGATRVMLVTDPKIAHLEAVAIAKQSCLDAGLDVVVFDAVRVEPTDISFREAIDFATDGKFDGFLSVGGGSVIDTAKAANLFSTYPAELLTYVNAPIGRATPVPGPLKPHVAVPMTAGTGSETTGIAIFELTALHVKTGIAHRALRPNVGIIDPDNTRTMPKMVAVSSGFDVLSHALESYTALPYHQRPAPDRPELRPAYQGSNPISDVWSIRAIEMTAKNIVRASSDPDDDEARSDMLLAATFAGIGFGNAGVHLPHGMSYPVAGMARTHGPAGYPDDHPMVPHGFSVILNAPAVFRFTASANPGRHLQAAALMGVDTRDVPPESAGEVLADAVISLMRQLDCPNGLAAVGYGEADLDGLVEGTLPQHRVTKLSPRPVDADDLRAMFRDAMSYW